VSTQSPEALLLPNSRPVPSTSMPYEQFLEWLTDDTHAEWVDGRVLPMSPITGLHDQLVAFLRALTQLFLDAHPVGELRGDPFQMKTGPDLPGRAPDVIFIANEHMARLHRTFLEGPADIAVEVISQESIHRDREVKIGEYQQGGVREYWLIDPENRRAEFFQLTADGSYQSMPVAEGVFRSQVLAGFWLKVDWLWQKPLPGLLSIAREWGLI
jgi:Uma2 family endonuclease